MLKPKRLQAGDTVALVTLSWGGASLFPHRVASATEALNSHFGVNVITTAHALKNPEWVSANPQARLQDLMWAFENPDVHAIISMIGGDDSIRMLEYLTEEHLETIRKNPKIFVGMSDTTVTHFICLKAGLTTFYGPSVLFGFGENGGMDPYTKTFFEKAVCASEPIGEIINNDSGWSVDRIPWDVEHQTVRRTSHPSLPIKYLQGFGSVQGKLIGGCADVLEFLKGTTLWPSADVWNGAVLFLETSEERPSPNTLKYWLRNYGAQNILKNLQGIIFGIPGAEIKYDDSAYEEEMKKHLDSFKEYEAVILQVCKEYGREDLIVATQVPFGHSLPMITLPYGVLVELDATNGKISIIESGVR